MPAHRLPETLVEKFSHLALADPRFDCPAPVELLFGADVFPRVVDGKRVLLDPSLPAAYGSIFGWIVIGSVPDTTPDTYGSHAAVALSVSLEDMVHRFWQVEEPEPRPRSMTTVNAKPYTTLSVFVTLPDDTLFQYHPSLFIVTNLSRGPVKSLPDGSRILNGSFKLMKSCILHTNSLCPSMSP